MEADHSETRFPASPYVVKGAAQRVRVPAIGTSGCPQEQDKEIADLAHNIYANMCVTCVYLHLVKKKSALFTGNTWRSQGCRNREQVTGKRCENLQCGIRCPERPAGRQPLAPPTLTVIFSGAGGLGAGWFETRGGAVCSGGTSASRPRAMASYRSFFFLNTCFILFHNVFY